MADVERLERLITQTAEAIRAAAPKVEVVNTLPKYYAQVFDHHLKVIETSLAPVLELLGRYVGSTQQTREKMEGIAYWKVSTGAPEGPALHGGLTHRAIPGLNGWLLHVNVESLDETVERVLKFGGSVVRPYRAPPNSRFTTNVFCPRRNSVLWR